MYNWKDFNKLPPPEDKLIIVKIKENKTEYITVAFYKTAGNISTWEYITEFLKTAKFTCSSSKTLSVDQKIELISWQPMPTNRISHP